MVLLDLLGRRMTLRILWELSQVDGGLTFRTLQSAAGTNPALLNQRLKDLKDSGIVQHNGAGYRLSDLGRELLVVIAPLNGWADRWAAAVSAGRPGDDGLSAPPGRS
jgi:DNA-binding HxlR family transcriptional regulator